MNWKKNVKIVTSDFWYDLVDGGYIKPSELLEDKNEVDRIEEAIKTLRSFRDNAQREYKLEYL